jgi:predicted enzyme related to lactoylglutathione lyase
LAVIRPAGRRRAHITQFILYTRDLERAASFYRAVFGWKIVPFPAPKKYKIAPSFLIINPGLRALEFRGHIQLKDRAGPTVTGLEFILAVASLEAVAAIVRANGGTIIEEVAFVPGCGGYIRFTDPDGNVVQAFQFPRKRTEQHRQKVRRRRTKG